jgi:hypothetical protein
MTRHPELHELHGPDRAAALAHVAACETCLLELGGEDPTRLFALLALEPIPVSVLGRVSAGVERSIDAEERHLRGRRVASWLSVAASLLLAAVLGTLLRQGTAVPPSIVTARPRPVGPAASAAMPAMLEVLDAPKTAKVVRMDLQGKAKVLLIFDEAYKKL